MSALDEERLHSKRVAEHAEWVRRLAYSLVQNRDLAEDLSQDTLAIALSTSAPHARLKSWLAAILHNRAHRLGRREVLRIDAEKRAREDFEAHEVTSQVERHHELVGKVLELPDSYRKPILLRFFRQATHGEIAEQLGIAEGTVRTRLTRGIRMLREKVEENHGSAGAVVWLWAAAGGQGEPPAELSVGASTSASQGVSMQSGTRWAWAVTAVSVTLVLWMASSWMGDPNRRVPDLLRPAPTDRESAIVQLRPSHPATGERNSPRDVPAVEPTAEPASMTYPLRGQVLDPYGDPLAHFQLAHFVAGEPYRTFQSDAQGNFAFTTDVGEGHLGLLEDRYVAILEPLLYGVDPGYELTVVASRRRRLHGRVVDAGGAPLSDVTIGFKWTHDFRPELGRIFDYSNLREWQTSTDELGRFVLEDAASFAGRLRAWLPGFKVREMPVAEWDEAEFDFVLEALAAEGRALKGRVVNAYGEGIPEALLWEWEHRDTHSVNRQGYFQISVSQEARSVTAVSAGLLPVTAPIPGQGQELEIRLSRPALELTGRVVDRTGHGLPGVTLHFLDLEHVRHHERSSGNSYWAHRSIEHLISGLDRSNIETDESGRFSIPGLRDRNYSLLMSDASCRSTISQPLRPSEGGGSPHTLVFEDATPTRSLQLRLLDLDGQPIQGLVVRAGHMVEFESGDPEIISSAPRTTNSEGRVSWSEVAQKPDMICVIDKNPRFMQELWRLPSVTSKAASSGEAEIEIRVRRRAYLQVSLDPGTWPDTYDLNIFDAEGYPIRLCTTAGSYSVLQSTGIVDYGLSPVYALFQDAHRLAISRNGIVLLERELQLTPGEILQLRE